MPVILTPEDAIQYLKQGVLPKSSIQELSYYEVTTKVNQVKTDDPSLIEAYDPFIYG